MPDFVTKRGSLLEPLILTLRGSNGVALNLTTAQAVVFTMRDPTQITPAVAAAPMAVLAPATEGRVQYAWTAQDVDTEGLYHAEVRVTWQNGAPERIPADGYLVIDVQREVDGP